MVPGVVDVLIYLVGEHEEVVVGEHYVGNRTKFFLGVYAAGGVARRTEYQHAGLGGDGGFELLGGHLEVLSETGGHHYGLSASQLHHLWVTYPIGSGYDNFFTIVDKGHDGIADTLLGTVGDEDFIGGVLQPVLVLQFLADGLAQTGISRDGGVA